MDLPNWISPELWAGFEEVRKKKKVPMTDLAARLIINKLDGFRQMGHDANKILEESIMQGWQGVFEPKHKPPSSAPLQARKVQPITIKDFERAAHRDNNPIALQALADMRRMISGKREGH